MDEFEGSFEILFTHQPSPLYVDIIGAVRDSYGHILYLRGVTGTIYNWSNIVIMKKVEDV